MIKISKWFLGCIVLLSNVCFSQESIVILTGEWAPYTSQALKYDGVSSHVVTEAFAFSGIDVVYKYFPWSRIDRMIKDGAEGGTSLIYTKTPERHEYAVYSEPILITHSAFFHLKSTPFEWNTVSDLKGIPIGGTLAYNYGPEFQAAEKNGSISVKRIPTDIQNLRKLLVGRITIFPISVDVAYALMNKNFTQEQTELITYHPKSFAVQNFHVIISKKNPQHKPLITKFNEGLRHLKESGKFDQYYNASRRGEYNKE